MLSLFIPIIRPYRCHACNWRGFVGLLPLVSKQIPNRTLNGAIFVFAVLLVTYQALVYFGVKVIP
jgi:hypothetical protein